MTWTCLRLELNGLSHISGETPLIWNIKICLHSCICPLSLWSFPKFDDISQIMSSGSYWPGLKNDTLKWRETWPMKSARSSFFWIQRSCRWALQSVLRAYLCVQALNLARSDVWDRWTARPGSPPPKPWCPQSLKQAHRWMTVQPTSHTFLYAHFLFV